MVETQKDRLASARDTRYLNLKNSHRDLYDRCVFMASVLASNHGLPLEAAAAIEDTLICVVIETIESLGTTI